MKTFFCLVYCAVAALWMFGPAAQAQVKIGPPPQPNAGWIGIPVQNYAVLDLSALASTNPSDGWPWAWAVALQDNGKVSFTHETSSDNTLASSVLSQYLFEQGNFTLIQRVPLQQTIATPDGPMPVSLGSGSGSFLTPGGRLFLNDREYLRFETPSGDPACPLITHLYGCNTTAEVQGGVPRAIFPPAPHDCEPGWQPPCNFVSRYNSPWVVVTGANDNSYICGQGTGFCYGKTNPDGTTTISGASDYAGLLYGPDKTIIFDRNARTFPSGSPSLQIVGEGFVPQSVNRNGWAINGVILWSSLPQNGYLFWSEHPQVWNGTSLIDIGPSFYNSGRLYALNDQNQIIGDDYADQWGGEGFLWEDGSQTYFRDQLPKNVRGQIQHISPIALSNQRTPAPAVPLAPDRSLCVLTGSSNAGFPYLMWKRDDAGAWSVAAIRLPEGTMIDWVGLLPSVYAQVNSSGVIAATGQPNSLTNRHALLLVPVDLAVDADRNGIVEFDKDYTSREKPFRFWINNRTTPAQEIEVSAPPGGANCSDTLINGTSDLVDITQLQFRVPEILSDMLKANKAQIGFKWKNASESPSRPSVRIWSGSPNQQTLDYLRDNGVATSVIVDNNVSSESSKLVSGETTTWLRSDLMNDVTTDTVNLLLEGVTAGTGKLVFMIKVGTQESEGPTVDFKLLDVRQMYDRAKITKEAPQVADAWTVTSMPQLTWVSDPWLWTPDVDKSAEPTSIVYVHGWRMTYNEYLQWADTTFKSLWQLGYNGRFYAFHWPTYDADNHGIDISSINTSYIPPGALTYNPTEYRAWLSGPALANFVNQLPNGRSRYLIAHSMGNVVCGAALRAGMQVTRYAMCNSAMAAMAYNGQLQTEQYQTPDTDSDLNVRSKFGLANKFFSPPTQIVNFFLVPDSALNDWSSNNEYFKPQPFLLHKYRYSVNSPTDAKLQYGFWLSQPNIAPVWLTTKVVTELPEAMGYVTQSRSAAVGTFAITIGNNVSRSIDMGYFGFGAEHSAEWQRSFQSTYDFWRQVAEEFDVPLTNR